MRYWFALAVVVGAISGILRAAVPPVYKDPHAPVESRVEDLLGRLTVEEKIGLLGGTGFTTQGVARLWVPKIVMTDGPCGTRTYGKATAYAAGIGLAASWDTGLAEKLGVSLGRDARARGDHILLAPGMNLYRAPMNGRNFEYLGEDPLLAGEMAGAEIKGVQSQGVAACVKHFAGNEQDFDRNNLSSDVDERTLRELYLKPFEMVVRGENPPWCVMNSYNPLNGVHSTQNGWLNLTVLKGEWGFKGLLMSDWESVYSAEGAANGGLDLEMPTARFMTREKLLPLLAAGTVPQATIDDKVRRQLRVMFAMGWMDRAQADKGIAQDDPASDAVALETARESIVLLKNEGGVLPLDEGKVKSIVVMGPNADPAVTGGGGSSQTTPFHAVSVLAGLQQVAGAKVTQIAWSAERHTEAFYAASVTDYAWRAEYFGNATLHGTPVFTRREKALDFDWWDGRIAEGLPKENTSARFTTTITPAETGTYEFALASDDGSRLLVNRKEVISNWRDQGMTEKSTRMELEGKHSYVVTVEYYQRAKSANLRFGWGKPEEMLSPENVALIKAADAVVFCAGFDSPNGGSYEGEGTDRSYALPGKQAETIATVAAMNPATVVVINSGGSVATAGWVEQTHTLLQAWYPGQNGGTAVTEILFGVTNPSAKLPISWEKKWEDSPTFATFPTKEHPTNNTYKEGVFLGYRYYDTQNQEVLFPFGYGLSYTTFEYGGLTAIRSADGKMFSARATVTNTGKVAGDEVVELFVRPPAQGATARPRHELKAFGRTGKLAPGASAVVALSFGVDDLRYWDPTTKGWVLTPGVYRIEVGGSSRRLPVQVAVTIK